MRRHIPTCLFVLMLLGFAFPGCENDALVPSGGTEPDGDVTDGDGMDGDGTDGDGPGDGDTDDHGDGDLDGDGTDGDGPDGDEPDGDGDGDETPRSGIDPDLTPPDLRRPLAPDPELPQLPEGITLRAMSYNIFSGRWNAAEPIGAALATYDADIICLQECPDTMVEPIAQAAGMEHAFGSGVVLLSRTPLENAALVPLTLGRSYAHAHTVIGGATFSLYCAHLGWNTEGNRQFREFTDDHLSLDPIPHLLIMGDFNDEHYSTQNTILEEFAADVFTVLGWYPGERISWPSIGFDDTEGSQLIDLIWFRRDYPAIVLAGDVLNLKPPLSDHKPVLADLLFPPADAEAFMVDPFAAGRAADRDFPPQDRLPPNLLVNPGAEEGLTGWETTGGAQAEATRQNQNARTGERFFTGWREKPSGNDVLSTGSQTVDLSAHAEGIDAGQGVLYVSGFMATGFEIIEDEGVISNSPKPYDEGELILDILDAQGAVLLQTSSRRRDTLGWHPYYEVVETPPGTRAARLTWASHHKHFNGPGNDAVFDDLYLGFEAREGKVPVFPNLLADPGAEEDGSPASWETRGWRRFADGEISGFALFAPRTFSGRHMFFAGGQLDLSGGESGISTLSQRTELGPYFAHIDRGELEVCWGGWVRTWAARTELTVALQVYDADGSFWGELVSEPIHDPEWTLERACAWIPPGASALVLEVRADAETVGTGVFADSLFVRPRLRGGDAQSHR